MMSHAAFANHFNNKSYIRFEETTVNACHQQVFIKIYEFDRSEGMRAEIEYDLEAEFYNKVKHEYIMNPISCTKYDNIGIISLPLCENGDLYTAIVKDHINISEENVIKFAYNLLSALKAIHSHGLIHKDLKLENILIKKFKENEYTHEKSLNPNAFYIIDGNSHVTSFYMSPEYRFSKIMTTSYDIWTLGVMLYIMIHRRFPYHISQTGDIEFVSPLFEEAITQKYYKIIPLIKNFLNIDHKMRLSAENALKESIFVSHNIESSQNFNIFI